MTLWSESVSERMHIIYVDDEPKCLAALRKALASQGIRVTGCQTVESLLALAPNADADAILVDYALGNTDGLTMFEVLRARGVTAPCVLYSGQASEEVRIRARQIGFTAAVDKTTSARELASILQTLTRTRRPISETKLLPALTLDTVTGELTDGYGSHAQLSPQPLALLLLLIREGSKMRRSHIATALFGLRYPNDPAQRKSVDDRIAKALSRLRNSLGVFDCLIGGGTGYVRLNARVRIARSDRDQTPGSDSKATVEPQAPQSHRTGSDKP